MNEELDLWFVREILPHEASLIRYLSRRWPNRDDVHEFRQEAYARVYEAAGKSRPLMPKSFLFATARNLIADHMRRKRVVSIETKGDLEALNVLVDEISPEQHESARQQLRHLSEAFDRLPPKCRTVLWMRRVEELSQKEVASRLGVKEGTVEKHVAKGVRLLADYLYGVASGQPVQPTTDAAQGDAEHAQAPGD